MQREVPNYMKDFKCIADDCLDTCCAGWDVDLDPDAYYYYQIAPAPFGDVIRSRIRVTDEEITFPLTKDRRCPFLNDQNLCDIITNCGENRICQTCREYPRSFVEAADYEQVDLNLSCMEVGRLFFEVYPEISYETSGTREESDEKLDRILSFRDACIRTLKDPSLPVRDRIDAVISMYGNENTTGFTAVPLQESDEDLLNLMRQLEMVNDHWPKERESVAAVLTEPEETFAPFLASHRELLDEWFKKLALYFVFRYTIDSYFHDSIQPELNMFTRSLRFLFLMTKARWLREQRPLTTTDIIDIAHLYSKQVEHSMDSFLLIKDLEEE